LWRPLSPNRSEPLEQPLSNYGPADRVIAVVIRFQPSAWPRARHCAAVNEGLVIVNSLKGKG
jgi:hypothetical protein